MSEARLLHRRLSNGLGSAIVDEITDTGIPHGRDGQKEITVPADSEDGILLFRAVRDRFFDSNEKAIVEAEEGINKIGLLFKSGYPPDILSENFEGVLKKGEKYGVRVKWSAAGRGILTVLGRRFAQFTHDIEADKIYVTGGNHSDDCIPLIRKLATRIKVLCGTDAYRRESWSTVLAQTEATDVFVNSSITNDLDSLTPTKEDAPRDSKRSKP